MSRQNDRIVFDAEPLIAHADDEHGSKRVDQILNAVTNGQIDGFLCDVNFTEIRYVLARKYDEETADSYLKGIQSDNLYRRNVDDLGYLASQFKLKYSPALGDAFALAAASSLSATLLIGADNDYDDITEVDIERFRTSLEADLATELSKMELSEGDILSFKGIPKWTEETSWQFQETRYGTHNGEDCEILLFTRLPPDDSEEPLAIQLNSDPPERIDAVFVTINGSRTQIDPDVIELKSIRPRNG